MHLARGIFFFLVMTFDTPNTLVFHSKINALTIIRYMKNRITYIIIKERKTFIPFGLLLN